MTSSSSSTTSSSSLKAGTSTDADTSRTSAEDHIFELSLFLLTAARGCVNEPHMYGPLRLVDAISRLVEIYSKTDKLKTDTFLLKAKEEIDKNKYSVMASEDEFVRFIDKLIVEFTDELKRRYSSASRTH